MSAIIFLAIIFTLHTILLEIGSTFLKETMLQCIRYDNYSNQFVKFHVQMIIR